jgi:hypothetical protein
MAKVHTMQIYADAGHAWLLIPIHRLAEVGLSEADISSCSYRKIDTVALEEDCDMATYLDAYRKTTDKQFKFKENYHETSPVRGWKSFGTKVFDY